jgi:putative ABC transport system permease protein
MNAALELGPILRSMRHHKGAFSLLVLEVALGFVMLTHTLIMARYYQHLHGVPTGMPEDELVVARRRFLHPTDVAAARVAARADLAALERTGALAAAADTAPLPDAAAFPTVLSRPNDGHERLAWPLRATPGIVAALGLRVIAGMDLATAKAAWQPAETPVLLTATVAQQLYGTTEAAVGQHLIGSTFGRARVAGVLKDFSFRGVWLPDGTSIVVVDAEPVTEHEIIYVMRAPGRRRADVIEAARTALRGAANDPADEAAIVVKSVDRRTARFSTISEGAVIISLWTGFLVVAVALAGSLALASFSVAERTRQIGVRRALGASRGEIVRYFLFENLLLTAFGLGLGLGLAVGFNQVLRRIMADLALTPQETLVSMAVFIATGLLSALVPARRAAAIPPWAATRTL